ncbi:MAG: nucleotidyltransferase domain-containing protein [Gaiellaceae bacterium]
MALNDWPGRLRGESQRQWPVIESLAARAAEIEAVAGLILLGSFAAGEPDELSDVDLLVVAGPGSFPEAWDQRHRLSAGALVSWDLTWDPRPKPDSQGHSWLTRELVKVDCTIVDPDSGGKELAEPIVVLAGPASIADRFPRISRDTLLERRRALAEEQSRQVPNPDEMEVGELIDWKLWEMKNAVRRGMRDTSS